MATLEQIIDKARSLSPAEKRKLIQALDRELEQVKEQERVQPTHRENGDDETRGRRLEWLKSHRALNLSPEEEYALAEYLADSYGKNPPQNLQSLRGDWSETFSDGSTLTQSLLFSQLTKPLRKNPTCMQRIPVQAVADLRLAAGRLGDGFVA